MFLTREKKSYNHSQIFIWIYLLQLFHYLLLVGNLHCLLSHTHHFKLFYMQFHLTCSYYRFTVTVWTSSSFTNVYKPHVYIRFCTWMSTSTFLLSCFGYIFNLFQHIIYIFITNSSELRVSIYFISWCIL